MRQAPGRLPQPATTCLVGPPPQPAEVRVRVVSRQAPGRLPQPAESRAARASTSGVPVVWFRDRRQNASPTNGRGAAALLNHRHCPGGVPQPAEIRGTQDGWPIRVALNGAATSSMTGAYTPVAVACSTAAACASADSHSAISTSPSGLSSISYCVLPRKPGACRPVGRRDVREQTAGARLAHLASPGTRRRP